MSHDIGLESVPDTSWWSRPSTIGAEVAPLAIASLKACAILVRSFGIGIEDAGLRTDHEVVASGFAYPVDIVAQLTLQVISSGASARIPSSTSAAMASLFARSSGEPEVHTPAEGAEAVVEKSGSP